MVSNQIIKDATAQTYIVSARSLPPRPTAGLIDGTCVLYHLHVDTHLVICTLTLRAPPALSHPPASTLLHSLSPPLHALPPSPPSLLHSPSRPLCTLPGSHVQSPPSSHRHRCPRTLLVFPLAQPFLHKGNKLQQKIMCPLFRASLSSSFHWLPQKSFPISLYFPLPASTTGMGNRLLTGPVFPVVRDGYVPLFYSIGNKRKISGDILERPSLCLPHSPCPTGRWDIRTCGQAHCQPESSNMKSKSQHTKESRAEINKLGLWQHC